MIDITYTSPQGQAFQIGNHLHQGVFIKEAGISGLVGAFEETSFSTVGTPGHTVTGLNVKPISAQIELHITEWGGDSVEEIFTRWRNAWSVHSSGTMTILSSIGPLSTPVKLAAPMPDLESDLRDATGYGLRMSVTGNTGIWSTHTVGAEGTVTVTNPGDVTVWPKITWSGQGGQVTLPSKATFELPATVDQKTLWLNNAEACLVTSANGDVDTDMWKQLRETVMPEGIPPAASAEFTLSQGARLEWNLGFLDPWR